jgi:hypothetical protein
MRAAPRRATCARAGWRPPIQWLAALRLLGRRYRASFTVADRVALGEAPVLPDERPAAGRAAAHPLQKRRYGALPRRHAHFWGRKEDALTGGAQLVAGSSGSASSLPARGPRGGLLAWEGTGSKFEFQPASGGSPVKLIASPDKRPHQRHHEHRPLQEGGLRAHARGARRHRRPRPSWPRDGGAAIQKSPDWSGEEKAKIAAFLQLPGA